MAYIFGTAFSKLWRFISPWEASVPNPTHLNPPPATPVDTATPPAEEPPDLEAYTNHDMGTAAKKEATAAADIPWLKIHMAHMSNLKGQLKYLRMIGQKKDCSDKVEKYIKRTMTCIRDAEAAAEAAGIISDCSDSKKESRRKRRLSVTFADEVDVDESVETKKVKSKEDPTTTTSKIRKKFSSKPKPSAEKVAALKPALGKHSRPETDSDEEEIPEITTDKPIKRVRVRYLQSDDPPCKYEGDPDTDDEDDADFVPTPSSPLTSGSSSSASSSAKSTSDEPSSPSTKSPKNPKVTTQKQEEATTESPKKQRSKSPATAGKKLQSPKTSKRATEDIEAPSAKKQKNTAVVVVESSKRRSETTEEVSQAVVDSGKNAKRLKST